MFVKICGLSTREAVAAAVGAGADALGFVFAASPRQVSPHEARALCRDVPSTVVRVAVMRHPETAEWKEVRTVFGPDWLQTDREDFETVELGDCEPLPVFRAAPDDTEHSWPPRILFEGLRSGRGERADWPAAARIATRTQTILAGGLDGDNVTEAIRAVRPWGVDVSSGVESGPGTKDPVKIETFIARAREAG